MNNPNATYRIQFHKDFKFTDLEKLIPYLEKLGIGTLYASPILESTPGSTHGYDGVNPLNIDPEIGTEQELRSLTAKLKAVDINWLQDIVPNHMAFHSANEWLMDVLEKGRQSAYATFFDMSGTGKLFHGRIMVPFLGDKLEEVIASGQLKLAYEANRLVFQYGDAIYPASPKTYAALLKTGEDPIDQSAEQWLDQIAALKTDEDPVFYALKWNELRLQLASLVKTEPMKTQIESKIAAGNKDPAWLTELLALQEYVLCHWQETEHRINFRRFFTVNGLICLNIQNRNVFDQYHQLINKLVKDNVFQGLRIDHIDGLYDPALYMDQLRNAAGEDVYIVVEKILERNESMPEEWPVQGTTGYEFLAQVNNLMTNSAGKEKFTQYYQQLTGNHSEIKEILISKKSHILFDHMGGELENLYQLFVELNLIEKNALEHSGKDNIKRAIGEFLIHCPVYRYYGNHMPLEEAEAQAIKAIFQEVKSHHAELSDAVDLLETALFEKTQEGNSDWNAAALDFYQRVMQFTGPLMAKGGEDTLMYTYNRFIGTNDVGDSPDNFGLSAKEFHARMQKRSEVWPLALNTTSTHDTKRGEDVRARLNVLTDLPDEWFSKVKEWQSFHAPFSKENPGPDKNDEYLIYQTLLGAYPMPGADGDDFPQRLAEYLMKAMREAKTNSSWSDPDDLYESATKDFATRLLDQNSSFWQSFVPFHEEISDFGIVNSLVQVVLKFTTPGVPDVYQGTELWDLSLVDPDNRRPVDYEKRGHFLATSRQEEKVEKQTERLWRQRFSGEVKLSLTNQLFKLRKNNKRLFAEGSYVPLKVKGSYKEHVFAFARRLKQQYLIVIVPLHTAVLCREQGTDVLNLNWKDTRVALPEGLEAAWTNVLSEEKVELHNAVSPGDIFRGLPLAILQGKRKENVRNAGILLSINSLTSPFGIGDMGPEAYAFADFLNRSNQRIWQILPLNPIEAAQGNSPYSALSSRAGNPLLISPELLAKEGLLDAAELDHYKVPGIQVIDYEQADQVKSELLRKAFQAFKERRDDHSQKAYDVFCEKNTEWLEDYTLYMVLKAKHNGQRWTDWPDPYKLRDEAAIQELGRQEAEEMEYIKWVQYVIDKQWSQLRTYCNDLDIKLLGDIPFYVSYDSADVWSHRSLFRLDETGQITGVAGVPPDAFSDDGQLWGMPVFNWDILKEQEYQWWVDRLKKNVELYDLIRLDHFRAFADYWEVPAGEKTAIRGEWKLGPDAEFFTTIYSKLGDLPFVAEDLGEISEPVFVLRDKFNLPGMKVLQYAFDESMPQSDFIPHNYPQNCLAYTGTHDNNTTLGWYRQEADAETRKRMNRYVGKMVSENEVSDILGRLVYASVAKTVILPMQDILNLDESCRMNIPGSEESNWAWRLLPGQLTSNAGKKLKEWTILFNRD